MITRLGELTISDLIPALSAFRAALDVSLGFSLPELQAKLAGLANILVSITLVPPSVGATLIAAIEMVAELQIQINAPRIGVDVDAILALIAELNLTLGKLTLALQLSLNFPGAGLSLSAYAYTGRTDAIGNELQTDLLASLPFASPSATTYALIIATTAQPAWVQLGQIVKTAL